MPPRSLEHHVLLLLFSYHGLSCARPRMPYKPASNTLLFAGCLLLGCLGGIILPIENAFPRCSFAEIVFPFFDYFSTIVGFRIWGAGFPISSLACTNQQKPPHSSPQQTARSTSRAYPRLDTSQPETNPENRAGVGALRRQPPACAAFSTFPRPPDLGASGGVERFSEERRGEPTKVFF